LAHFSGTDELQADFETFHPEHLPHCSDRLIDMNTIDRETPNGLLEKYSGVGGVHDSVYPPLGVDGFTPAVLPGKTLTEAMPAGGDCGAAPVSSDFLIFKGLPCFIEPKDDTAAVTGLGQRGDDGVSHSNSTSWRICSGKFFLLVIS